MWNVVGLLPRTISYFYFVYVSCGGTWAWPIVAPSIMVWVQIFNYYKYNKSEREDFGLLHGCFVRLGANLGIALVHAFMFYGWVTLKVPANTLQFSLDNVFKKPGF